MNCRHCDAALTLPFLDLGSAPPSNAYLTAAALRAPEVWYPLRLLVCERCWLVQTEDHAGREALFTDDYAYFSSFSASWLAHAAPTSRRCAARFDLGARQPRRRGRRQRRLPAAVRRRRPAFLASASSRPRARRRRRARAGLDIVERFFGVALGRRARRRRARRSTWSPPTTCSPTCPTSTTSSPASRALLKPDGVATFEFPHLLRMVERDPVRHRLPRALLLPVARPRSSASSRRTACASSTSRSCRRTAAACASSRKREDGGRPRSPTRGARRCAEERRAGVAGRAFYGGFQARGRSGQGRLPRLPARGAPRRQVGRRLRRGGQGQHAASTTPACAPT